MHDALVLLVCRILCWLFPLTLTALRRIAMLLTWKTVGLYVPSSSSAATCVRPLGRRLPKNASHKTGPDDLRYDLVFFSTFEELVLPIKGPMEDAGVVKLY